MGQILLCSGQFSEISSIPAEERRGQSNFQIAVVVFFIIYLFIYLFIYLKSFLTFFRRQRVLLLGLGVLQFAGVEVSDLTGDRRRYGRLGCRGGHGSSNLQYEKTILGRAAKAGQCNLTRVRTKLKFGCFFRPSARDGLIMSSRSCRRHRCAGNHPPPDPSPMRWPIM